jgi:hypothetical protein
MAPSYLTPTDINLSVDLMHAEIALVSQYIAQTTLIWRFSIPGEVPT